jgi:hypothetical protein
MSSVILSPLKAGILSLGGLNGGRHKIINRLHRSLVEKNRIVVKLLQISGRQVHADYPLGNKWSF